MGDVTKIGAKRARAKRVVSDSSGNGNKDEDGTNQTPKSTPTPIVLTPSNAMDFEDKDETYLLDFPTIRSKSGEPLVVEFRVLDLTTIIRGKLMPGFLTAYFDGAFRSQFGSMGNENKDVGVTDEVKQNIGLSSLPDLLDMGCRMIMNAAISPKFAETGRPESNVLPISIFQKNTAAILRYLQHEEKGALTQAMGMGGEVPMGVGK